MVEKGPERVGSDELAELAEDVALLMASMEQDVDFCAACALESFDEEHGTDLVAMFGGTRERAVWQFLGLPRATQVAAIRFIGQQLRESGVDPQRGLS